MTDWAELDDVLDVTGREASPESLALAHTIIELYSGTAPAASDNGLIAGRNLELLRKAVCFQAVWLDSHPDVLDAMDVSGISQDGLNAQYTSATSHVMAPLAAACLRRLSWKKAALRPRRGNSNYSNRSNRDSAVADDQYTWTPL